MAERKQPDHTYVIRPSYKQKFPVGVVKEIMRNVLKSKLQGTSYNTEVVKEISEVIRNKLKELGLARYKYMVQVVVGEQKGEGVRMGSRCFWDSDTDNFASETFINDELFAVATAFGVYMY